MDGKVVVGAGNIYATESLFTAKINPTQPANTISLSKYNLLAETLKTVLAKSIKAGGTTLRDFAQSDGKPGYFVQQLQVYGKKGTPCAICATNIEQIRQSGRSTFFCPTCQKAT